MLADVIKPASLGRVHYLNNGHRYTLTEAQVHKQVANSVESITLTTGIRYSLTEAQVHKQVANSVESITLTMGTGTV